MPGHDIIVIGASAGGVEAIVQLVKHLPPDLPAAIFVTLHVPAHGTSVLPNILNRCRTLEAVHPKDTETIQHGRIYVAPPDYHLLVKRGYVKLTRGPRENSFRPAIDPMFRTAARAYGARVVGVVLSGTLDDGTAGLEAVKLQGGVAVVQDPDEAMFVGMPRSAIENVDVDHIMSLADIASLLIRLAHEPVAEEIVAPVSREMEMETDVAEINSLAMQNDEHPGKPSGFACPDCGGVLWKINREGEILRFRCRTGHALSAESLLARQSEALEEALWTALRALEERAALARRMVQGARDRNRNQLAKRFDLQQKDAQERAAIIRQVILKGEAFPSAEPGATNSLTNEAEFLRPNTVPYLVAVAASAGGLNALSQVLSALPLDFPAAITVVQHLDHQRPSLMVDIMQIRTQLKVKQAEHGDVLQPSTVYIAPANKHLLVNQDGTLCLGDAQLVHFVRPSADLLFESVAASFKDRAIAIVLSGTGVDGARGVEAIKEMGGKVIAQDPATSEFVGMPQAAIDTKIVDFVLSLDEISSTLVNLINESLSE